MKVDDLGSKKTLFLETPISQQSIIQWLLDFPNVRNQASLDMAPLAHHLPSLAMHLSEARGPHELRHQGNHGENLSCTPLAVDR